MDFRSTSLKAHLRQADRLGALYTIPLGDDEIEKGTATLRNMQTKAQEGLFRDLVSPAGLTPYTRIGAFSS